MQQTPKRPLEKNKKKIKKDNTESHPGFILFTCLWGLENFVEMEVRQACFPFWGRKRGMLKEFCVDFFSASVFDFLSFRRTMQTPQQVDDQQLRVLDVKRRHYVIEGNLNFFFFFSEHRRTAVVVEHVLYLRDKPHSLHSYMSNVSEE